MLVDETHALMTLDEFESLPESDGRIPEPVELGLRWKIDVNSAYSLQRGLPAKWEMGEYVKPNGHIVIKWREVIVV